jgi:hypothetical protein
MKEFGRYCSKTQPPIYFEIKKERPAILSTQCILFSLYHAHTLFYKPKGHGFDA